VTQALDPQQTGDASTHADPVLFMAQGTIPEALPPQSPASSPDWTFTPYNQVANDYFGYQLMRPYQRIRQTHNPKCAAPCTAPWYIQILNSQLWSSFNLTYQLRVTCQSATDQQGCPSPALSEAAPHLPKQQCSDNGSCQVFDPVCTDATFAQGECTFCECNSGWGDVGCNIPTPDLALDTEQLYSTESGVWSFFNVALDVSTKRSLQHPCALSAASAWCLSVLQLTVTSLHDNCANDSQICLCYVCQDAHCFHHMVCMTYFDLLTKDTYYVLSLASASKNF